MPRFWLVTIVLALGSGLLLGPRDVVIAGVRLSGQGLTAGALMVLRGAFVFGLTSWATRAASVVGLHRLARRVGLGSLGLAVATAFGVLPAIRDRLVEQRKVSGNRGVVNHLRRLSEDVVREAVDLADRLTAEMLGRRASFVAVLGNKGTGKTTALRRVIEALENRGVAVGGIIQPPVEGETERLGYDVLDLRTGKRRPLTRRGRQGRFVFSNDVFRWAGERLRDAHAHCDVVTVDELGLVEAKGGGHLDALVPLAEKPGKAGVLLAVVRRGCLEPLAERLGAPVVTLTPPLAEEDIAEAAETIARLVSEGRGSERVDWRT